jgi:hypothetical protein
MWASYALYSIKGYSYDFLLSTIPVISMFAAVSLIINYYVTLPAIKNILLFFELNHPQLCSWLPESALLEAKMVYE